MLYVQQVAAVVEFNTHTTWGHSAETTGCEAGTAANLSPAADLPSSHACLLKDIVYHPLFKQLKSVCVQLCVGMSRVTNSWRTSDENQNDINACKIDCRHPASGHCYQQQTASDSLSRYVPCTMQ